LLPHISGFCQVVIANHFCNDMGQNQEESGSHFTGSKAGTPGKNQEISRKIRQIRIVAPPHTPHACNDATTNPAEPRNVRQPQEKPGKIRKNGHSLF